VYALPSAPACSSVQGEPHPLYLYPYLPKTHEESLIFVAVSFVIKKKGLIAATRKSGNVAGEGHAYLKSWLWWVGMSMMIVGEICNFVAFGEFSRLALDMLTPTLIFAFGDCG
jgi:hypothetical protein